MLPAAIAGEKPPCQKEAPEAQETAGSRRTLRILEKYQGSSDGLIAILEDVQAEFGYLPEAALRVVGERTGRPLVDIYGVATFYRAFRLAPRGRHSVCACLGTACHVRGAPQVVEELQRQLGIQAGQTTPDGEFTLETVNCLGACALGPVVVVDGRYFTKVSMAEVRTILNQARLRLPPLHEPLSTAPSP